MTQKQAAGHPAHFASRTIEAIRQVLIGYDAACYDPLDNDIARAIEAAEATLEAIRHYERGIVTQMLEESVEEQR